MCDHSNESYIGQYVYVVLFIIVYKIFLTFKFVDKDPSVRPLKWKLLSSIFQGR